ncbi:MAG: mechanosensitive ion channel family protein [bacterium]
MKVFKYISENFQKWFNFSEKWINIFRLIRKKLIPILYYSVFYYAMNRLSLDPLLNRCINYIGFVLLVFLFVSLVQNLTIKSLKKYWFKKDTQANKKQLFDAIVTAIKLLIWLLAILLIMDNIGIKLSGLIAGLGIGGIAIAFAAQAILEDIFSYFIMFFDKPFEVGDFLIIDDFLGSVEYIGLKTTRIRSIGGEQLIFANKDLVNSRIKNYKRMEKRRILFKFGVVYHTPVEKLEKIPEIIKEIIGKMEMTEFERCHFQSYGEYSLIFEVVYYILDKDYNIFMDINQKILIEINKEFTRENISFAYPTQKIYTEKLEK